MKKILFVCLGNICRSSTAEGVMLHLLKEAGREKEFVIDSAGILSYHQGELPDSRMRAHAIRRGYDLVHRSRPVRTGHHQCRNAGSTHTVFINILLALAIHDRIRIMH